jgi:Ni,Fe-hydrogenase I cytochrome b subunit
MVDLLKTVTYSNEKLLKMKKIKVWLVLLAKKALFLIMMTFLDIITAIFVVLGVAIGSSLIGFILFIVVFMAGAFCGLTPVFFLFYFESGIDPATAFWCSFLLFTLIGFIVVILYSGGREEIMDLIKDRRLMRKAFKEVIFSSDFSFSFGS